MTDDPIPPLLADVEASIAITTAAAAAVSSMFDTVFATLTTDLQQLLQTNGAPNPLAPPLHALTTEMIKVLSDRVKATLDSPRK